MELSTNKLHKDILPIGIVGKRGMLSCQITFIIFPKAMQFVIDLQSRTKQFFKIYDSRCEQNKIHSREYGFKVHKGIILRYLGI